MVIKESLSLKFQALADPTRRAIVSRLAQGDATVAELGLPLNISQPAVSKHLKVLERAGLIEAGKAAASRPRRLVPAALDETYDWTLTVQRIWSQSLDRLEDYLTDPRPNNEGEQR